MILIFSNNLNLLKINCAKFLKTKKVKDKAHLKKLIKSEVKFKGLKVKLCATFNCFVISYNNVLRGAQ